MLIELLLVVCGFYILLQNLKMKITKEIPKGLINPKVNLEAAPDIEGFIKYIFIRGVVFGAVLIVFGGILLASRLVELPQVLILIAEIVYVVTIIYYGVISVKAQNRFLFRNMKQAMEEKRSARVRNAASYVNPENDDTNMPEDSANN